MSYGCRERLYACICVSDVVIKIDVLSTVKQSLSVRTKHHHSITWVSDISPLLEKLSPRILNLLRWDKSPLRKIVWIAFPSWRIGRSFCPRGRAFHGGAYIRFPITLLPVDRNVAVALPALKVNLSAALDLIDRDLTLTALRRL